MAIPLQQARPEDAHEVAALVNAAYAPWIEVIGLTPGPMRDDYAARIRDDFVAVLREDNTIVAALVLIEQPDAMLLDNVAVHPDHHGKGLGNRLLAEADDIARSRGFDTIRLYAHERMTRNITLYERRGYRITHRVTEHGFNRVYMEKPLGQRDP